MIWTNWLKQQLRHWIIHKGRQNKNWHMDKKNTKISFSRASNRLVWACQEIQHVGFLKLCSVPCGSVNSQPEGWNGSKWKRSKEADKQTEQQSRWSTGGQLPESATLKFCSQHPLGELETNSRVLQSKITEKQTHCAAKRAFVISCYMEGRNNEEKSEVCQKTGEGKSADKKE